MTLGSPDVRVVMYGRHEAAGAESISGAHHWGPFKIAAVAYAAKMARIIWAMLVTGEARRRGGGNIFRSPALR